MPTKKDFDKLSPAERAARDYADEPYDPWHVAQRKRRKELLTRSVLFALAVLAFIALVMAWLCAPASAHESWIAWGGYIGPDGTRCCGENDCRIIEESDISVSSAGYTIKSLEETIPYMEALPSEDQDYWRCHKDDGSRRCFFAPQPGS